MRSLGGTWDQFDLDNDKTKMMSKKWKRMQSKKQNLRELVYKVNTSQNSATLELFIHTIGNKELNSRLGIDVYQESS